MKTKNSNYDYYKVPKIRDIKELVELRKDSATTAFAYRENGELKKKSYHDVYMDVRYLSAYFYEHFNGKKIGIIGENSYQWLVCSLAIMLSGNVCVAFDKDSNDDVLKRQIKIADVHAIFYSSSYCENIPKLMRKSFILEDWEKYCKEGRKCSNKAKQDANADAMIFFTSGTTGFSKAVILTQKNIASDIYAAASIYKPGGKTVDFLPFHHAFGYTTATLMPFYYGAPTLISSSLKNLIEDFKEMKPSIVFAVPLVVETLYKQIWRSARKQKSDKKLTFGIKLSNGLMKLGIDKRAKLFESVTKEFGGKMEHIICGGARLDVSYVKWFRSIGIEILNGYGITECSPVVAVNRNHFKRDGSVGQLCRDVEVKIIDGEVAVKGDIVMKGYYKDRKATESVFKGDYLLTGDLGYVDEDGFLFITGRKKDLIILSNGENVSPEEIEDELKRDKAVEEVMVYEFNNRIVATFVPKEGYLGDKEYFDDLIYGYNKDKAKNRQIAFANIRSEAFPRNNNGKVLRRVLIEEETYGKESN